MTEVVVEWDPNDANVLLIRLDKDTLAQLVTRAEREHSTPSVLVRDAIKSVPRSIMKYRINAEDVTLSDGTGRTEADYERMNDEAEHTEPGYDAIFARARPKGVDPHSAKASRRYSKSLSTRTPGTREPNTEAQQHNNIIAARSQRKRESEMGISIDRRHWLSCRPAVFRSATERTRRKEKRLWAL